MSIPVMEFSSDYITLDSYQCTMLFVRISVTKILNDTRYEKVKTVDRMVGVSQNTPIIFHLVERNDLYNICNGNVKNFSVIKRNLL